jgi:redox-sensing transcriptional repressor
VQRLPLYLHCLDECDGDGRVSSSELAAQAGVNAAKVRKDLSYLGSYGVRGVGYEVEHLKFEIKRTLGLTQVWRLAIVGIGNLGTALASYDGFRGQGFEIVGLFDIDEDRIGTRVMEQTVEPIRNLAAAVAERLVDIAVIATPRESAQEVADVLAESGIKSILNFAPIVVKLPDDVEVRRVDLSTELQVLSYHLHRSRLGV